MERLRAARPPRLRQPKPELAARRRRHVGAPLPRGRRGRPRPAAAADAPPALQEPRSRRRAMAGHPAAAERFCAAAPPPHPLPCLAHRPRPPDRAPRLRRGWAGRHGCSGRAHARRCEQRGRARGEGRLPLLVLAAGRRRGERDARRAVRPAAAPPVAAALLAAVPRRVCVSDGRVARGARGGPRGHAPAARPDRLHGPLEEPPHSPASLRPASHGPATGRPPPLFVVACRRPPRRVLRRSVLLPPPTAIRFHPPRLPLRPAQVGEASQGVAFAHGAARAAAARHDVGGAQPCRVPRLAAAPLLARRGELRRPPPRARGAARPVQHPVQHPARQVTSTI
mmetsp:Transcript_17496/g.57315  ORF Transcript_17496/g.57315 Transcript_17496/m.57315 type:complete len:339 (-) Transcript_17496:512-1528(-)